MSMGGNVYFNTDHLVEGRTVKLTYKGILATPDTSEIYIHYGFGLLWDNLQEVKLDKIDDTCYEADITLCGADSISFCFRDDKNNWDNNETQNYTETIGKEETTLAKVEPTEIEVPRLKKSYLMAKKLKLTFYKIITYIPKLIKGEWKKKVTAEK